MNQPSEQSVELSGEGGTGPVTPLQERNASSLITSVIIWLFLATLISLAFQFPWQARRAPLLIESITLLLVTLNITREIFALLNERKTETNENEQDDKLDPASNARVKPAWEPYAWLGILVTLFILLGFGIGMTIFMVLFIRIYGKESWLKTLAVTFGVLLCTYGLFVMLLGAQIYPGVVSASLGYPKLLG